MASDTITLEKIIFENFKDKPIGNTDYFRLFCIELFPKITDRQIVVAFRNIINYQISKYGDVLFDKSYQFHTLRRKSK